MKYQDHIPDDNFNKGGRSMLMVIDTYAYYKKKTT